MPHSPFSSDRLAPAGSSTAGPSATGPSTTGPSTTGPASAARRDELMLRYTADIVTAYLQHNQLSTDALLSTIRAIYATVAALDPQTRQHVEEPPTPAVDPAVSVHPDYLICLEDGVRLKMLKRHLREAYNLTPEAYRQRWGLPPDYPMMAPNHAAQRSRAARERARRAPPGFMAARRAAAADLPEQPRQPEPAVHGVAAGPKRGRPAGRRGVPPRRPDGSA